MKFLYADSLDYVDPHYDFIEDRSAPGRQPYWDDEFAHQVLERPPYDGILVSRGIVGDYKFSGKYTQSQAMRFRRDGARTFLRLRDPRFEHLMIFGDCGAFSYHNYEKPPYTPTEILEFYDDGGFTHGCSVDHIIFDYQQNLKGMESPANREEATRVKERFDITLENAKAFYQECKHLTHPFTPLGVVQGWSPGSMAEAARRLVGMGYDYLAIGGMVPLGANSIHKALSAIREMIPDYVRLHLLGFGKVDEISDFCNYGIESIDTTSPMVRAFKDTQQNFFMPGDDQRLRYYKAIRIPNALEHRGLGLLVKKGHFTHEFLLRQEREALGAVRGLDRGDVDLESALEQVMAYTTSTLISAKTGDRPSADKLSSLETSYRTLLEDRPWQSCQCNVCQQVSVEVAILRASNRNKRRGIHNLWVFYNHLKVMTGREIENVQHNRVHRHSGSAK